MNSLMRGIIRSMAAIAAISLMITPDSPAAAAQGDAATPHHHHALSAAGTLPGASLYQLPMALETSDGGTMTLADFRGRPLLITMFYSHCTSICPLLTAQLQRIVSRLPAAEQHSLQVLMVSFDTDRDTPEALTEFRSLHHIDDPHWIVARASASDVRALAATLGIRYRDLADGGFNHSAVVSLADRDGVIRARSSDLTAPEPTFMAALRTQTAARR